MIYLNRKVNLRLRKFTLVYQVLLCLHCNLPKVNKVYLRLRKFTKFTVYMYLPKQGLPAFT